MTKCTYNKEQTLVENYASGYQPKATTLTCVLVRMVALVLILEYLVLNSSLLFTINHK